MSTGNDNNETTPIRFIFGLDFGTVNCAAAWYPYNENAEVKDITPYYVEWEPNNLVKVPNMVLLEKKANQMTGIAFGEEAKTKYNNAEDIENLHLVYHYKMCLYQNTDRPKLKSERGAVLDGESVFVEVVKLMANQCFRKLKQINNYLRNLDEVLWVVTVPAIWAESAKLFMRKVCKKSGLKNVHIALEPEAASIACRYSDWFVQKFTEHRNVKKYLILDCGGGTIDIAAHYITDKTDTEVTNKVKKKTIGNLIPPEGDDAGSVQINKRFETFLSKLTNKTLEEIKNIPGFCLGEATVMEAFEKAKKEFKYRDELLGFAVPTEFVNSLPNLESDIKTYNSREGKDLLSLRTVNINRKRLVFSAELVKRELIGPVVDRIVNRTCAVLEKKELEGCKLVIVVGGFANCDMLRVKLHEKLSKDTIVSVPDKPDRMIVFGALLTGLFPNAVDKRILGVTYGLSVVESFVEGKHPKDKKTVIGGINFCKDVFSVLASKGRAVSNNEIITKKFVPPTADSTSINFFFYFHPNEENAILYIDHPSCQKVSSISILLPPRTDVDYKKRTLSVNFKFGTNIDVEVIDDLTNTKQETVINYAYV